MVYVLRVVPRVALLRYNSGLHVHELEPFQSPHRFLHQGELGVQKRNKRTTGVHATRIRPATPGALLASQEWPPRGCSGIAGGHSSPHRYVV